jgi:hypothetical protein
MCNVKGNVKMSKWPRRRTGDPGTPRNRKICQVQNPRVK